MSPENQQAQPPGLDPWGLRQVEELLGGLEGVDSLKIVPDGQGGIDEVHVVSASNLGPKQIVRNIESALLAEFGLQVDHRKISIARVQQADIGAEAAALGAGARGTAAHGERWLLLDGVQIDRKAGHRVQCRVSLKDGDSEEVFEGEAEGPDFSRSRLEVASGAVLDALNSATLEDVELRLEGVTRFEAFGRDLIAVVVQGQEARRKVPLPGISLVTDSAEEAAVLACLQATNRWAGAV